MENPFSYTGIVRGDAFCNRQTEQTELLKFIKGSQNVLLFSHRRYGKSSLIYKLFNRLERQRPKIDTLYVELYGTLSEKDFVSAILAGLIGAVHLLREPVACLLQGFHCLADAGGIFGIQRLS